MMLLSLLLLSPLTWAEEWRFDNVDRVVAIADIHGAFDAMKATLQSAKVIDDDLSWIGDTTHLVIVGDILDRGPGSRAAMELLMRLEGEAENAGGKVHVIFGNHESMPMTGDMRYVSAAEYQAFAADEDSDERSRWFDLYVEQNGGDADALKEIFDKEFPPGYFAMRRAFRADGRYGQWLLQKNIIVVINGTAFVHGGLSPWVAEIGLDGVNGQQKNELIEYVKALAILTDAEVLLPTDSHYDYNTILTDHMPALDAGAATLAAVKLAIRFDQSQLLHAESPLWYRGNIACSEIVESDKLNAGLAAVGADRVVVGHTPTPNRKVLRRFDGRLLEIDTGMLNFYYKGSGNALVLEGDSVSVINQATDASVPMDHPRRVGRRPDRMTASQLEEALEHGEIVSVGRGDIGTLVTVLYNERMLNAVFDKQQSRDVYPGVAAYRLDRLLELDMVPVTVVREIEGKLGSLQFLPDNRVDEAQRSAAGEGYGAQCPISEQWQAMYVFDVLIYNEGRSPQRITYDRSSWNLILSGHDRTFAKKKGRPPFLKKASLVVSQSWKEALGALTDDVLQQQFADVLDSKRIASLRARRDQLIAMP